MTVGLSGRISAYTTQSIAFPLSGGTAALQFNRPSTVYASHTVAGAINFTVNATGAVDGNRAIVRLVSNGTNIPTFSADFKERNNSLGYDNTASAVNIIQIEKIGANYWYSITQELVTDPVYSGLLLPLGFSTRVGNIAPEEGNYVATAPYGYTTTYMLADRKIAANADGWVQAKYLTIANSNVMLFFNTTNENASFANGEYGAWVGAGAFSRFTDGTGLTTTGVASPVGSIYRLARIAGTVTLDLTVNGTTWTNAYTWPGTNTAELFIGCAMNQTRLDAPYAFNTVVR